VNSTGRRLTSLKAGRILYRQQLKKEMHVLRRSVELATESRPLWAGGGTVISFSDI
jgi:hypothetical protein